MDYRQTEANCEWRREVIGVKSEESLALAKTQLKLELKLKGGRSAPRPPKWVNVGRQGRSSKLVVNGFVCGGRPRGRANYFLTHLSAHVRDKL